MRCLGYRRRWQGRSRGKLLQAQLREAKRLAAEVSEKKRAAEKTEADADSLAAQAKQAEQDRLKGLEGD